VILLSEVILHPITVRGLHAPPRPLACLIRGSELGAVSLFHHIPTHSPVAHAAFTPDSELTFAHEYHNSEPTTSAHGLQSCLQNVLKFGICQNMHVPNSNIDLDPVLFIHETRCFFDEGDLTSATNGVQIKRYFVDETCGYRGCLA
jgi:hypothetical protein